jgi:hypothetical protein
VVPYSNVHVWSEPACSFECLGHASRGHFECFSGDVAQATEDCGREDLALPKRPPTIEASGADASPPPPPPPLTEAYCAPLESQLTPVGRVNLLPVAAARLSQPPVIEV